MPERFQRSRRRGERLPSDVVVVTRPTKWGNPHPLELGRAEVVRRYRDDLLAGRLAITVEDVKRELQGRDLACYCPLDEPCHADVLIDVANQANSDVLLDVANQGNPDVDEYLQRSEKWPDEMTELRPILLSCGLTEEIKWGKPCYSHEGTNIVILQEMKDFLALMFFKGALLPDPKGVLEEQGPNSRSARRIRFTSVADVARLAGTVEAYVDEAIHVEEAGLELDPAPELVPVAELQHRLDQDPAFRAAFEALTPGRQREYNLYFSDAKQAKTRVARVEKCVERILDGKGLRDR